MQVANFKSAAVINYLCQDKTIPTQDGPMNDVDIFLQSKNSDLIKQSEDSSQTTPDEIQFDKNIPPLYGVYLLNSLSKKQCFYVGSTPDPKRRLRQHNGELTRGGAYRTKKQGYRPWRVILYVYGFPSRVNALQFEHAWQHAYQTRHIPYEKRINPEQKRTGSGTSLHSKLANCRLLLSSDSFKRLGLKVAIFNNATYDVWLKNKYAIDIPDDILIDIRIDDESLDNQTFNTGNYNQLSQFMKSVMESQSQYFEKCAQLYQNGVDKVCKVCMKEVHVSNDADTLCFCTQPNCEGCYHMKCLANKFLNEEKNDIVHVLPKKGRCIVCKKMNFWNLLIRGSKHLVQNYL